MDAGQSTRRATSDVDAGQPTSDVDAGQPTSDEEPPTQGAGQMGAEPPTQGVGQPSQGTAHPSQGDLVVALEDSVRQLAESRRELARRVEVEQALREIAGRLTVLHDPAEVLQRAVDAAAALLEADGARIDLQSETDGALYWGYDAVTGKRPGLGPIEGDGEADPGEGISGRAVSIAGARLDRRLPRRPAVRPRAAARLVRGGAQHPLRARGAHHRRVGRPWDPHGLHQPARRLWARGGGAARHPRPPGIAGHHQCPAHRAARPIPDGARAAGGRGAGAPRDHHRAERGT